jgi:class 3 adenylate cyclase
LKNELLARIKTHIELSKINVAYGRFVPHEFLRFLGHKSIVDVHLGDQVQKEMSILFADIRNFTTLSEGMSPKENFDFLNSYLKRVGPVIRNHNGFIDKYIGDAVMALFPDALKMPCEQRSTCKQKSRSIMNTAKKVRLHSDRYWHWLAYWQFDVRHHWRRTADGKHGDFRCR